MLAVAIVSTLLAAVPRPTSPRPPAPASSAVPAPPKALAAAAVRAGPALDATFRRFEAGFEAIDGHTVEIDRELSRWAQLDVGAPEPVDGLLDAIDPAAHVTDDLFDGKVAFAALLNFPLTTLDERLARGDAWTRLQWAEVRLAGRFARRVPAEVNQGIARAAARADAYIADYNLYMHHVLSEKG